MRIFLFLLGICVILSANADENSSQRANFTDSPATIQDSIATKGDFVLPLNANVITAKIIKNSLLFGLDSGEIWSLDLPSQNLSKILTLPKISTIIDENLSPRITAIDEFYGKIAFIYESDNRSKKLGILTQNSATLSANFNISESVKNIYFLDDESLLLLDLSSEILYFNIASGKISNVAKLSASSWIGGSDFSRESGVLTASSEGGIVYFFDTKKRQKIKELAIQKDILYSISAIKDRFIAGSAENLAYYFDGKKAHIFKTNNKHVFCVGLSENFGAFYSEDGIEIFSENGEILRHIDYFDEQIRYLLFWQNFLISLSYDNKINFWRIK